MIGHLISTRWGRLFLLLGLTGCAGSPWALHGSRFDPGRVMRDWPPASSATAEQARQTLRAVREVRVQHGNDLVLEQIDCHQRFLVSGCLEQVAARSRLLDDRLDAIEVSAHQRLRDLQAIERSRGEAQAAMDWQADAPARAMAEARNRERYDTRQQEALKAAAEREEQAPELRRREQVQRERQLERERAFEQRQSPSQKRMP